jgi:hypothetical protein
MANQCLKYEELIDRITALENNYALDSDRHSSSRYSAFELEPQ